MPFDPRIVRIEDELEPDCEALHDVSALHDGLPPELADLATKLQADAAWLASMYPAGERSAAQVRPAKASPAGGGFAGRMQQFSWSQVALVLVMLAFAASAWWWQRAGEQATPATELAIHPTIVAPHAAAPTVPVMLPSGSATSEAGFLWREASGPELEGLLDLMEDDALADSVVSL